jgi:hypothetical protein
MRMTVLTLLPHLLFLGSPQLHLPPPLSTVIHPMGCKMIVVTVVHPIWCKMIVVMVKMELALFSLLHQRDHL